MALCLYGVEETLGVDESKSSEPCVPIDAGTSGTGGVDRPRLQARFEPVTHPPTLYGEQSGALPTKSEPPRDQLMFIRKALKLNVSDLASVLGVSRPTVYAWLDGDEPSPENYTQVARLKRVADEIDRLTITRVDKLLKRPIFDGLSFFDKLNVTEEALECLPLLKQLADKERAARGAPKGSGKTQSNDGFLEQSTPFYETD